MLHFDRLRQAMIEEQLIPRGIKDEKVLEAFRRVPRQAFFPQNLRDSAYDDGAFPIGEGQTISQPYMVALMTELLDLKGNEKVLEIGTGSGYQAAILAELCKKVYTVERIKILSARAKEILEKLDYTNIEFVVKDGSEGYAKEAPYDRILVTAAAPEIPPPLVEQLAEKGKLVIPLGETHYQTLTIATKENGKLKMESSTGCVFVPLIGKYGGK